MIELLQNKLRGRKNWELTELPQFLEGRSGIMPLAATLDARIGEEILLVIADHTPFLFDLAKLDPFDIHLKAGAVNTESGPVIFLLFWVEDPQTNGPFCMWDLTVNPSDTEVLKLCHGLAHQTHWHVVLAGLGDSVMNLFEYENEFGLGDALNELLEACSSMSHRNFDAAKAEYETAYSLQDLFEIS